MISVIIPVYNNEKYIARCLDSLIAQSYSDFEALVINDGSKDDSGKIIQEYAKKDSRFRYFEQENQGVSVARNKGLDNARGDYVLFLDGDDWLDADVLERLIAAMEKDNLDCVSYMFRHVYEDGTPIKEDCGGADIVYHLKSAKEASRFFDTTARHAFYTSQQHLFKRSIIEDKKLRFAQGVRRGEDALFVHMYAIYVKCGVLLEKFHAYNYYHHSASCMENSTNPWKDIILENFKTIRFFYNYLVKKSWSDGWYFEAAFAWEILLHLASIEKNKNFRSKISSFQNTKYFWNGIIMSNLLYGGMKRKIMVIIYLFSKRLFTKLTKI